MSDDVVVVISDSDSEEEYHANGAANTGRPVEDAQVRCSLAGLNYLQAFDLNLMRTGVWLLSAIIRFEPHAHRCNAMGAAGAVLSALGWSWA